MKARAHNAASALAARHDQWAASYDADTARYGWCAPTRLHAALAEICPPTASQRVLDVGVGTGQASAPFVSVGAQVTGLDVSAAMLTRAAATVPGFHHLAVHDLNAPFEQVGVVADRFDVIVSCGSMHYARDLRRTLTQLATALDAAGVLAFTYIPPQARSFSPQTQLHSHADVLGILEQFGMHELTHERFVAYHEKADVSDPVIYELIAVRDRRRAVTLPASLAFIDRTACVDRPRLIAAAARPLPQLAQPLPANNSQAPLCDVLAITAHPDDESVYMGATLSALRQAGHRIELACLTDGAGGRGKADAATKATERAGELEAACGELGVTQIHSLGFDDFGKYRDAHRSVPIDADDALTHWGHDEVVAAIMGVIVARRPRIVLGFDATRDPNYSLHGHHLAAGRAAALAVRRAAKKWAVECHWAIVPATAGAAVVVKGNARAKQAAVAAHASQGFSLTRLMERLGAAVPESSMEHWHLVHLRVDASAASADHALPPLIQLAGEPAFALARSPYASTTNAPKATRVRAVIVDAIAAQARRRGAAEPTMAAIAALREEETQVVITGQQVGLFGGPMYTLLKALGAVRRARALVSQGTPAAAVMWLASLDHDADEVARVDVLGAGREPVRMRLLHAGARAPVGHLALGHDIERFLDGFAAHIAHATWADDVMASLRECYVPGATFAQAFGRWFGRLTDSLGLILVDPDDKAIAGACAELYTRVIERTEVITNVLEQRYADIARRGQTPTVARGALDSTLPLLLIEDSGRRVALRRDGKEFVSTTGQRYSAATLTHIAERSPQRLSPDVLLRPLCSDVLFGSAIHVLGPTEARYFEQSDALAEALELQGCAFEARPSVALATASSFDVLARLPISTAQLLQHPHRDRELGLLGLGGVRDVVEQLDGLRTHDLRALRHLIEPAALADGTAVVRKRVAGLCTQLGRELDVATLAERVDVALQTQVAAARGAKAGRQPSRLGARRAARELSRLVGAALRTGRRNLVDAVAAANRLRPLATPQERILNVAQAIAEHGFELPAVLLETISRGPGRETTALVEGPG